MDAEEKADLDQTIDPIGPPELPTAVRYGARALALSGVITGVPLAVGVIGMIATWPWPPVEL
jgi:hypothetical protein